jgi:hypothetical protein
MIRHLAVAALLVLLGQQAEAQSVKVLTPTSDSCSVYTKTMEANENPTLTAGLSGWALGFVSGVAQGRGRDILRRVTAAALVAHLYTVCKQNPDQLLSLAAEGVARELMEAPAP